MKELLEQIKNKSLYGYDADNTSNEVTFELELHNKSIVQIEAYVEYKVIDSYSGDYWTPAYEEGEYDVEIFNTCAIDADDNDIECPFNEELLIELIKDELC